MWGCVGLGREGKWQWCNLYIIILNQVFVPAGMSDLFFAHSCCVCSIYFLGTQSCQQRMIIDLDENELLFLSRLMFSKIESVCGFLNSGGCLLCFKIVFLGDIHNGC